MGSSMTVRPLAGCHCTCTLINWLVLRHCWASEGALSGGVGKWYMLVIVDDFLRYSWVFFMEAKDEAFSLV